MCFLSSSAILYNIVHYFCSLPFAILSVESTHYKCYFIGLFQMIWHLIMKQNPLLLPCQTTISRPYSPTLHFSVVRYFDLVSLSVLSACCVHWVNGCRSFRNSATFLKQNTQWHSAKVGTEKFSFSICVKHTILKFIFCKMWWSSW